MRTYKVTFSADNVGNVFRYKADTDGFKSMRAYIFMGENALDKTFVYRLANVCDDIKDLPVGESLFVISSHREVYTATDIDRFNKKITQWDNIAQSGELGEDSPHYQPNVFTAFMVKRTAKQWILSCLNS